MCVQLCEFEKKQAEASASTTLEEELEAAKKEAEQWQSKAKELEEKADQIKSKVEAAQAAHVQTLEAELKTLR